MLSAKYEIAKIQESKKTIYSIRSPMYKKQSQNNHNKPKRFSSLHGRVLQALRRLDPRWVSVPSFASTWKLMVTSKYPSKGWDLHGFTIKSYKIHHFQVDMGCYYVLER